MLSHAHFHSLNLVLVILVIFALLTMFWLTIMFLLFFLNSSVLTDAFIHKDIIKAFLMVNSLNHGVILTCFKKKGLKTEANVYRVSII